MWVVNRCAHSRSWVAICAAVIMLCVITGAGWHWTRPDPERLWRNAELAFRAGRRAEARALLRQVERLRQMTTRDWLLRAQLASAAGDTDSALAALAQVRGRDSLSAQAALMAGRLERARSRIRAAETWFRRALAIEPGLVDAHKELVYIYGVQLRRRELDAEFRALGRLTALSHHDLFTWSLTHFSSWSPDIAADLQRFVNADPSDRFSRLALAEILLEQPGQAEFIIRLLAALPASDPDAFSLQVGLAFHEGRLDDARALLETGPDDHPGLARFRGRLAMLRHDSAAAVHHYRLAQSAEPYDRSSTFELGQALALSGQEREADLLLTRARRLNELYNLVNRVRSPQHENGAPDLLQLGAACEAAGLSEEARRWYALAIQRDPTDPQAQRAAHRLKLISQHEEAVEVQ
jgi:tetratricopeptide (TPR) repeat protein